MLSTSVGSSTSTTLEKIIAKLAQKTSSKYQSTNVEVGYRAKYALWVHEMHDMLLRGKPRPSGIGVYWGPKGASNFLLGPAKKMGRAIAEIVKTMLLSGHTLKESLLFAGNTLKLKSQEVVPVEHGKLRDSAYVKVV